MKMINYGKHYIDQDDIDAVNEVLVSDFLTTGPKIKAFEKEIAEYTGAKYCIAVSNGTAALHIASLALLSKGDKILTTPNSFLATSNSILYADAMPIFVDIEEKGNIDLDLCEKKLKEDPSIKGIYAVAFSGRMIDQKKLKYLKEKYDLIVVEDCAHALGAVEDDIKAGSCKNSDVSILSFHPVKHITTGEGGAVTTNSEELYHKMILLRNHGILKTNEMKPWEYQMLELGFNYRLTDIQGALGISQLKKLDGFLEKRKDLAKLYDSVFQDTIVKPLYTYSKESSYHLYVVKVDFSKLKISREKLFIELRKRNINVQVHYIPINTQPYYKKLGYGDENTPVMNEYYEQCFSIPLYPHLKEEEQNYFINNLFDLLK